MTDGPGRVGAPPRGGTELAGGGLIALASLQFGMVVVLGKTVLGGGLSPHALLAVRFGVAAALLAAVVLVLRRPLLAAPGERLRLAALGVAGYGLEAWFFFAALDRGTAAATTLLFFTYPVFVALGSWLLGRGAPGRLLVASLLAAVAGAALVVATSGGIAIRPTGTALALASSLTFSGYLLGAEGVLDRTDGLTGAVWTSAFASLGLGLVAWASGGAILPDAGPDRWRLLGMGAATAGAFVCLLSGLRLVGAVRAAIVSAMEPLAAAVLAALFLQERISAGTAVGGALILAGAVAASV
ncbi:MAG TPA: DMT family transporter, partial [Actinomycetota bacterium]|nr:DMT family transporter [Actinomycetota bacterium]